MKKKSYFGLLCVVVTFLFGACLASDKYARMEVEHQVEKMKSQMPFDLPGSPISISDAGIEDDTVVIVATMPGSEIAALSKNTEDFDKSIDGILKAMSLEEEAFVKAGLSIKYLYKSSDSSSIIIRTKTEKSTSTRKREWKMSFRASSSFSSSQKKTQIVDVNPAQ